MAIRIKSCASKEAAHARQTYFWDKTMRGFAKPTKKKKKKIAQAKPNTHKNNQGRSFWEQNFLFYCHLEATERARFSS